MKSLAVVVHVPMDCSTITGHASLHLRFQPYIVTPTLLRNHRSIRLIHLHQSSNPPIWKLSASMNGCSSTAPHKPPLKTIQTRTLDAVSSPSAALQSLFSVLAYLRANPPPLSSGIIRLQVPIQQQICAIDWLHSQGDLLPRFYFSGRDQSTDSDTQLIGHVNGSSAGRDLVSVAGVGSAVYFRSTCRFGIDDWRSIRRFLSKESPLIRAYGAIRFDASADASVEWKPFGSYYFMIPQIEFDELEGSAIIAATVAWDDEASHTWENATEELHNTMSQISSVISNSRIEFPKKRVVSYKHIPSKASWEHDVERALQSINKNDSSLMKVVLARSSMILTSTAIDPIRWLACLQAEGANAYQFCLQPPDSSAFIGNTPERLFHRRKLSICSEALAGTRARGKSHIQDVHIEHDLLSSPKDHLEFSIVQSSIQSKLEAVCSRLMVVPQKSIRKLSRVQHLYVKLAGTLHREDNEFDILSSLHPSPAVCGFPTEEAMQIISETEVFDRGMYAGPVGWFGGEESEFAVGIRSALVDKGHGAVLYAGTGIVNGSNPSQEWDELELKTSQFTNLIEIEAPLSEYQESHH